MQRKNLIRTLIGTSAIIISAATIGASCFYYSQNKSPLKKPEIKIVYLKRMLGAYPKNYSEYYSTDPWTILNKEEHQRRINNVLKTFESYTSQTLK
jgi:hypothetical protein